MRLNEFYMLLSCFIVTSPTSLAKLNVKNLENFDPCGLVIHYPVFSKVHKKYYSNKNIVTRLTYKPTLRHKYIHMAIFNYKIGSEDVTLPPIFRSQTYNCHLHVILSNDKDLESYFYFDHVIDGDLKQMVLKNAKLILIQTGLLRLAHTSINFLYVRNQQMFIFQFPFVKTIFEDKLEQKRLTYTYQSDSSGWVYFCTLCDDPFIDLFNGAEKRAKLALYQRRWRKRYTGHMFQVNGKLYNYQKLSLSCGDFKVTSSLIEKSCHDKEAFVETLIRLSGFNITLTYIVNVDISRLYIPNIYFETINQVVSNSDRLRYRMLQRYSSNKVAYCIYEQSHFTAQRTIWFKHVDFEVWVAMLFFILAFGVLKSIKEIKSTVNNLQYFLKSSVKNIPIGLKMLLRQSENIKVFPFLIILEISLIFILGAYENFITVELVVPPAEKSFSNITELIRNDYIYLYVNTAVSYSTNTWVEDEFNTKNRKYTQTLLHNENIYSIPAIKKYFGFKNNGKKFLFSGNDVNDFNRDLLGRINIVLGYKYRCHLMEPKDVQDFQTSPVYFTIESALATDLLQVLSRFMATGFNVFINRMTVFADNMHKQQMRQDILKSEPNSNVYADRSDVYDSTNFISIDNCLSVVYIGAGIIVLSGFVYLIETSTVAGDRILQII